MEYDIREAVTADIPAILSLYAEPDMDDGKIMGFEAAREIFRKFSSYPNYRLFVASVRDRVVGTYALIILDNLAHMGAPSALVEDVVVESKWRRKGVGRAMINHAISLCREANCYKLALSSNLIREPAHRFYEALGFAQHGISFVVSLEK